MSTEVDFPVFYKIPQLVCVRLWLPLCPRYFTANMPGKLTARILVHWLARPGYDNERGIPQLSGNAKCVGKSSETHEKIPSESDQNCTIADWWGKGGGRSQSARAGSVRLGRTKRGLMLRKSKEHESYVSMQLSELVCYWLAPV